MLKTLLLSAAFVGASVIGGSAQSTMQGGAGADVSISASTHCKDANGQARMKRAGNSSGSTTSGGSVGHSGGAAERPAGSAPPATGSSGSIAGSPVASGGASTSSGSAAPDLPNC
jgi:hypothetical protein